LPVLFVCENNGYAMGTSIQRSEAELDIRRKAECYNIAAESVDGMDVAAVHEAATRAVASIRETGCPYFLECRTYRFRAHSMFDPELYRDKTEVQAWKERDPIITFIAASKEAGLVSDEDVATLETEVGREIEEAVAFADAGTLEPVSSLADDVYGRRPEGGAP